MSWLEIFILALVEGATEFLPISSTGHLIITSSLFGIGDEGFVKSFNIIIQFGAIMSVLVLYRRRFLSGVQFYKKLVVGFLPAAVIGFAVKNKIDAVLGSPVIVAVAFVLGGVILILSDKWFAARFDSGKSVDDLSYMDCFKIGLCQCVAFIPGVSRSASAILGGLFFGMRRQEAAEFSFFLAVPTLTGAAFLKTWGIRDTINPENIGVLVLGCLLAFIFSLLAIQFFISLVGRFGFKHFGWYRIILGLLILGLFV